MKMPFLASALTIVWYLLLVSIVSSEDSVAPDRQLLMIGNSYTNHNDLFLMMQSMLEETYGSASASKYTPGGKTLSGHLSDATGGDDTNTLRRLLVTEPEDWDWVTLQEQSQTAGFVDYPSLYFASLEGAIGLDAYVEAIGGETVFFMTWGRRNGDAQNSALFPDFLTMNAKLAEGYQRYVEETSTAQRPTKLAPVGMAFETIYRGLLELGLDPLESGSDFASLYANDGSHPSVQGSYLAACVLYSTMTERDCRLVGYTPSQLTEETAIRLRDVAYKAVQENAPTLSPSLSVTDSPTQKPTETPTIAPTHFPTETPTLQPVGTPTGRPTRTPVVQPTRSPTESPTVRETLSPSRPILTMVPTTSPSEDSNQPSPPPSATVTFVPTRKPTMLPSERPTQGPTRGPSSSPSAPPSDATSDSPTISPSAIPTSPPSVQPSQLPTTAFSVTPSQSVSSQPSRVPTNSKPATPFSASPNEPMVSQQPNSIPAESLSSSADRKDRYQYSALLYRSIMHGLFALLIFY